LRGFDFVGEVGGDGGKDVAAMKSGGDIREPVFGFVEVADFGFWVGEDEGEEAVVGTNAVVLLGLDEEWAARGAYAGIDDGDVDGALGEIAPGLIEKEGSLGNGVGGDFVSDVDDGGFGRDGGDDAFEGADEVVSEAEVSEERDHHLSVG